tara:strand:- start:394 stop:633 length:240 start_codon:yes stop_codon:yes gene_type:complete
MSIDNRIFAHYRDKQEEIKKAKGLLIENGMLVLTKENRRSFINKLQEEIEWYRTYGEYVNSHFPNVDADASSYADGDTE